MASVRQVAAEVEQLSVSLRQSAERFPAILALGLILLLLEIGLSQTVLRRLP
jgi:hypothetical protein